MVEIEDEDGLRLRVVEDACAVARTTGASDDVRVTGKVAQDGRLVMMRVEDGGDAVPETDNLDKLSRLHRALSHDGPAEMCPEAGCRRARADVLGSPRIGREDKTHPAGARPAEGGEQA